MCILVITSVGYGELVRSQWITPVDSGLFQWSVGYSSGQWIAQVASGLLQWSVGYTSGQWVTPVIT